MGEEGFRDNYWGGLQGKRGLTCVLIGPLTSEPTCVGTQPFSDCLAMDSLCSLGLSLFTCKVVIPTSQEYCGFGGFLIFTFLYI